MKTTVQRTQSKTAFELLEIKQFFTKKRISTLNRIGLLRTYSNRENMSVISQTFLSHTVVFALLRPYRLNLYG